MQDTAFLAALVYAVHPAHAQQSQPSVSIAQVAVAQRAMPNVQRIAVAAHDLPRGTVLSAADIAWTIDSATPSARTARAFGRKTTASSNNVVPGWITRRTIHAGELLEEPSVGRPDIVTNGDPVDIVYYDDGIRIKLHGTAIGNGAQGDEVYVKLDNRRRLRGVVENATTVRIL